NLVARVSHQPEDDELLSFLDSVDCVADAAIPIDEIGEQYGNYPSTEWVRSLLRVRAVPTPAEMSRLKVRLVYVPSTIEHQLGGVPLIGLEFLRDRMERQGARVNVLNVPPADFDRRVVELL